MESVGPRVARRRVLTAVAAGAVVAAGTVGIGRVLTYENPKHRVPESIERFRIDGVEVLKAGKEGPVIFFLHNSAQVPLGIGEHADILSRVGQVFVPNLFDLHRAAYVKGNKNPGFPDLVNEFSNLGVVKKGEKIGFNSSSLGASFVWEYAAQNPQDVAWVVAGSPTGWPLNRSFKEWALVFLKEYFLPPKAPLSNEVKRKDPGLGLFFKRFKEHPQSVAGLWKASMNIDQRQQMSQITQPVDLLWGETDNYIPYSVGEKMAELMINSRLAVASLGNHGWMIDAPALVNPAVERARAMPKAA